MQKGLGLLRYESEQEELAAARESVRRWWWEYLRLSQPYWLLCKLSQGGNLAPTSNKAWRRIYWDFCDVHSTSFDDWWVERGHRVFGERSGPPKVQQLEAGATYKITGDSETVVVEIPLKLSRQTIQRQIGRILDEHEARRRELRPSISTSEYPINPVRYRLHTLKQMHEVWNLYRELIEKPIVLARLNSGGDVKSVPEPSADLFRIGQLLHISPSSERLIGDEKMIHRKKNVMRATVSRLLRRAEMLIGNVENGEFPVFKLFHSQERAEWVARRLERNESLLAEWWSLDLSSSLSYARMTEARRIQHAKQAKVGA